MSTTAAIQLLQDHLLLLSSERLSKQQQQQHATDDLARLAITDTVEDTAERPTSEPAKLAEAQEQPPAEGGYCTGLP